MINVNEEHSLICKYIEFTMVDLSIVHRDLITGALVDSIFETIMSTILEFRDIEPETMFNNGNFLDTIFEDIVEDILRFNNEDIEPDILLNIEHEMVSALLRPIETLMINTLKRIQAKKVKSLFYKNKEQIRKIEVVNGK